MSRIARFAIRQPKLVIVGWIVMVLALGLIGRGVEDKVLPTELLVPGTEPDRAEDMRKGHFGEDAAVLLRGPKEELDRQGRRLARDLALRPGTRALSPWTGGKGSDQLRPSPNQALIPLDLRVPKGETQSTIVPPLERFVDERVESPVDAHLSGESPLGKDLNEATTEGAHKAELIAAPVLVIVLLLVFRTPVAAAIPLIMGQGTVFASFGVISLILGFADLDAIALSLAAGVGLALGVDYSLLIITRFREALADGLQPRQAASLAANTAGRTAVFAGSVLIAIMLVSFFLSPGTVLLSSAVGAIASTALGMLGAALVTPATVSLAGYNVNRWQIGGRRKERGRIGGIVRRVSRRPALAAAAVLAVLMLIASPVAAIEMIPPDPRQLPEDSQGLEDYRAVRAAGFGPTVEIVLRAPRGAVMDPDYLDVIEPFERRLKRVRYVSSVFGPGTLGERTEEIRDAPRSIRRAKRQLNEGEEDLSRLARGLVDATEGVSQLRQGMLLAAFGAQELRSGSALARAGSSELAAGAADAQGGAQRIAAGNQEAYEGSGRLTRGARDARRGSERLAAGNDDLSDRLNNEFAPGANRLATELRAGQQRLNLLRVPAQTTEREVQAAFDTLNRMTVGKTDPLFLQALRQVGTAVGAATGRNPLTGQGVSAGYQGLDASIAQAVSEAGQAADGADQLAAGAREAAAGARRLSNGANDLADGVRRLERGNAELEAGLADLAEGSPRLARGLAEISAGASELDGGLGEISAGNAELASGLESGHQRSAPLESGLGGAAGEVGTTRDQLAGRSGPFRPLRSLEQLQKRSPNFFESGYVPVAAFDGARPLERDASTFMLDADRGGGNVGRVTILPDVPTNDPRTQNVIDDVSDATDDFEKKSGLDAAIGGTAGKMVEYDRVTSGRLPLLVAMICLVTYLMLVPVLRSLFLPAIAVALNMLTVAASFGVLSLLFVGDNPPLGGAGALDVLSVASIFTITFALSIDYQVFLLTRMREEFVRTQSNDSAIEFGIEKTAKVVTGAAAIMIAVFVAFAASDFVILKQFGVGLATAILIDATVVRLALLPAVMRLFGLQTWWLPDWLDERLPVLDVEGSAYQHESESLRPRPSPA
jgi:putative drug exporter of the RND superfamily